MNALLKFSALALALGATFSAHASPKINFYTSVQVVDGPFGGTLLASMTSEVVGAGFSGELRSAVYSNGLQGTDIYYQFFNYSGSANAIGSIGQHGVGSTDLFNTEKFFIGAWYAQTNAAFGMFTAGTAKAGETWSYLSGYCTETCGTSYLTTTEFLSSGVIPGTEVLAGIAPGTASYTGVVRTFGNGPSAYTLGAFDVDGQPASAFISTVPEPEIYAMLIGGLGLLGALARRKKNKQA